MGLYTYGATFLAGAASGSFVTYEMMKDKKYSPELLEKIGGQELVDKYIALREDPVTRDHTIVFDTRNQTLHDVESKATYIRVRDKDANHGEPVVAHVITKDNAPILVLGTTVSGAAFYYQHRAGFATQQMGAGEFLDGSKIPVRYNKLGSAEQITDYIDISVNQYRQNLQDTMQRFHEGIWESRATAKDTYLAYSEEFDKLPAAEQEKFKARITPEMHDGLQMFINHHIVEAEGSPQAVSDHLKKSTSAALNGLSDEKLLYMFEKAVNEGTIPPYDLASYAKDPKFKLMVEKSGVDIEAALKADVKAKKEESAKLAEQIAAGKKTEDKSSSGFHPLDWIKENKGTAVLLGLAGVLGGTALVSAVAGWMGVPAAVTKTLGYGLSFGLLILGGMAYMHMDGPMNKIAEWTGLGTPSEPSADKKEVATTEPAPDTKKHASIDNNRVQVPTQASDIKIDPLTPDTGNLLGKNDETPSPEEVQAAGSLAVVSYMNSRTDGKNGALKTPATLKSVPATGLDRGADPELALIG